MKSSRNPRIDPRTKLAWLAVLLFTALVLMDPLVQLGLALLVGIFLIFGLITDQIETKPFWAAIKALAGMLIVLTLVQGFLHPGETVIFSIRIFGVTAEFSVEGMQFGAIVAIRFVTISFAFMMFFLSTPARQLSIALQKLGIPYKYSYLISMALDRLPRTVAVMNDIEYAQASRGFDIEAGGVFQKFRNVLPVLIPLVVMSLREADRMAVALELRGFGSPTEPNWLDDLKSSSIDRALSLAAAATFMLVLVVWIGRLTNVLHFGIISLR